MSRDQRGHLLPQLPGDSEAVRRGEALGGYRGKPLGHGREAHLEPAGGPDLGRDGPEIEDGREPLPALELLRERVGAGDGDTGASPVELLAGGIAHTYIRARVSVRFESRRRTEDAAVDETDGRPGLLEHGGDALGRGGGDGV